MRESPTDSPPSVVSLVLTYEGRELTLASVESLLAMDYPRHHILVVDNGSTDGTREAVLAAFPRQRVEVVRVEINRGISHGLNTGMRHALAGGYDYLLLLNNDIEAHPAMLREMVKVAEDDPSIGCVGPKTYFFWDRRRLWSAGGVLRFKESVTRERGAGELDRGQWDRDEEVDYINGCAMLARREALEAAGPWDPVYHFSVEDADWCMRLKRAGFTCWFAHRALLWHKVSQTTGGYKASRTFQTGRSTALFVRRYAGPWGWLTFLLFFAAAIPAAFLRELTRGNQGAALAKLRGALAGLRHPLPPPPRWDDERILNPELPG